MRTPTTTTTTTTTNLHSSCQLDQTSQRPTRSGWVGTPTRRRPGRRACSVDHAHAGIWTLDSPFHLASSLAPKNQCRRVSLRKDYRYWDGSFSWDCREKPERRWVLDGQQGLACAARSNRPRIRGKHANGGGVWGRPIMRSGHSCPLAMIYISRSSFRLLYGRYRQLLQTSEWSWLSPYAFDIYVREHLAKWRRNLSSSTSLNPLGLIRMLCDRLKGKNLELNGEVVDGLGWELKEY